MEPPLRMTYQGRLLDSAGNPREGDARLVFGLYAAPTGGTALWSEVHDPVALDNGFFTVQLGSYTALMRELFAGASAYLQVEADPAGALPSELFWPRQRLAMVPWAFSAAQAVSSATVRVEAGPAVSTFTIGGDLLVRYGVSAGTASFTGSLTASSGTFTASGAGQFSLETSSGLLVGGGTLKVEGGGGLLGLYGVEAGTLTVLGTGDTVFGVTTASGARNLQGTLRVDGGGGVLAAYGISAATGAFTATGAGTFSVDSSSGMRMQAGSLRLGPSDSRTLSDRSSDGSLLISSNAVIVGSFSAGNYNWVFLASNTLTAAGNTLSVSFRGEGYVNLFVQVHIAGVAAANILWVRLNNDSGASYAAYAADSAGAPTTYLTQTRIQMQEATSADPGFFNLYMKNVGSIGQIFFWDGARGLNSGTAPAFYNGVGFWSNTTAWVTRIDILNSASNNFTAASSIRVFGAQ